MKNNRPGRISRIWKWAFFFLLMSNLAFLTVLVTRVTSHRETGLPSLVTTADKDVKIGRFETNRNQLNQTFSAYLKPYQTKQFTYQLVAGTSTILFEGTYQLLGYDVPLYLYLSPHQLDDGRVQLVVTDFSVGTLPLPATDVLRYVKSSYQLPSVVTIVPNQESIFIDLTKLDNPSGFYLKAAQIDLLNDQISFDLYRKSETNQQTHQTATAKK